MRSFSRSLRFLSVFSSAAHDAERAAAAVTAAEAAAAERLRHSEELHRAGARDHAADLEAALEPRRQLIRSVGVQLSDALREYARRYGGDVAEISEISRAC